MTEKSRERVWIPGNFRVAMLARDVSPIFFVFRVRLVDFVLRSFWVVGPKVSWFSRLALVSGARFFWVSSLDWGVVRGRKEGTKKKRY